MKPIGILLLCAGLTAAQQQAASPGPPVPFEDAGACPFEGCVYRTWTANRAVAVRTERRSDAPIAFRLTKAWFNGRLYDDLDGADFFNGLCDQDPERCQGKVVERPSSVWWVQVEDARKRVGWTDEPTAFDGRDALGGR